MPWEVFLDNERGICYNYRYNHHGQVINITQTDTSGNITDTLHYDTYGKMISPVGESFIIFGYNGRDGVVTDKNGLIYMRARYYSPDMKRFINADIVAGEISNAVTLNRFAYANGNPVSFVDPFGLSARSWFKETKRQLEDAWNTFVAELVKEYVEPIKENIIEPVSNFVAEKFIEPTKKSIKENIVEPVLNWTIENAPDPIANFARDIQNYDRNNSSEQTVLESHYFSSYKGKFVLNLPIGRNAFSFGIIFMGTGVPDTEYNTVKHEYGHTVQFDKMGMWNYTKDVAIPSVTGYLKDPLPYSYYTAPWEAEADKYGGVNPADRDTSDPWRQSDGYYTFMDLIGEIFS